MPTIAAAENVRTQVYRALAHDAVLVALLANGANSILPRQGIDPLKAQKPFLWVRLEGEGSLGDEEINRAVWAIEVHDRPGYGLLKIDAIVDRIQRIFRFGRWETPTASIARPRGSAWAGATGEMADQAWTTIKRIARVAVYTS